MGWFSKKYGEDVHPELPIETFSKLYDDFGEEAANQTLADVQDGKISVNTLEKYLYTDESKEEYSARLKEEYEDFKYNY